MSGSGNNKNVGVVVLEDDPYDAYRRDAARAAGLTGDRAVTLARDVAIGLEHANHFARSVNQLSSLRDHFNMASSSSEKAAAVNGRLVENSAALDDNLARVTSHLSSAEALKFRREFMKHHDLMQTTDRDGHKVYVENPDEKRAQRGDFVVKPNLFAQGNQL